MAALKPDLLARYECDGFRFPDRDYYDRHVVFDHVVPMETATQRERFEAVARTLRDVLTQRWIKTAQTHDRANPKQVYYLSMEFLIGRSLVNNIINLGVEPLVREELTSDPRQDWKEVVETEPDAGLGNGGLGRLAACFIDSLATLQIPAVGYGLRYDYGIFRQEIVGGRQVEHPDPWLSRPDPWEVVRPGETVTVPLATTFGMRHGEIVVTRGQPMHMLGIPYDRPVVGYGGRTINTLRLWKAGTASDFDFGEFSGGDFFGAVSDQIIAESLTRVLYPDDSTPRGRSLRFLQEYFLVRCSLADIVTRFRRRGNDWPALPDKVAVQLNDTHPAMAVPELMRILLDEAHLGWDRAWDLTVRTLAYTNHTLLPEALEKWPVELFETLLPRHLEIVYEINRRFLDDVRARHPGEDARLGRVSLIEEGGAPKVRMANLAIVGTHSTNGVAAIHSELLRTKTVPDFAELFPDRFNNKTNGVTPRRWLLLANPDLAKLLTDAVGDGWVTDLSVLRKADPLAADAGFREKFLAAKRGAKARFVDWIKAAAGITLDPDTLFDVQIKRIHEYKRQLLNALQVVVWYNRLRANPGLDVPPRTVLFAGKAAPAYHLAKVIIQLITSIGRVVNADPATRGKLRVEFLPNYSCTLAEHLIPAADVSEQISTAGYEASGTSNMKFMMNGALTVGTRDGANIEIAEEAGEENCFMFGLTAGQVLGGRGWYSPRWHYENEPETRAALDLVFDNHFSRGEPGIFEPIRETLLTKGDYYMHLADLTGYVQTQQKVAALYGDRPAWAAKAVRNIARSGKFSSDRTIAEYAREVCGAEPMPDGLSEPEHGRAVIRVGRNAMNWEQRYRLRHAARTSLVLWAGLALAAALVSAPAVRWLDRETGWVVFGYSPDGARAVLGALVGSMLTFIVFVLSATLIVVQLASGQLTPRIIALVFARPGVKVALGLFTFTYAYTLAALGRVEGRVPDLHVGVAVVLNLGCILGFFLFVQQLSAGLRPNSMMRLVADRGWAVIEQVYPAVYDPKRPEPDTGGSPPTAPAQVVGFAGPSGVVMAFSVGGLVRLARDSDVVVELVPQVGDFVATGDPLFRVSGGPRPVSPDALRGCVAVGAERTMEQDPRFVLRVLVDIASKALSPGINDPTSAVLALDQIHHLLLCLGRRHLDDGRVRDRDGTLRLVYGTPDWPDYVMLAVSEIRQFGEGSLQVDRRLRAMLEHLIRELPEARRQSLAEELALLSSGVERGFQDEEDRKRAGVADYQGVGGSDS